jgi:hypothetical protein
MKTFLISIAGMFLGGILLLIVLLLVIRFALSWVVKKVLKAVVNAFGQSVPPFRITLKEADDAKWQKAKVINGATAALEAVGYTRINDFRSEEMPLVQLRALVNTQASAYAVLMQVGLDEKVHMDVVSYFADGGHVTVTTTPENGLDRPEWSNMVRTDVDLVKDPKAAIKLHERVLEEQQGRTTVSAKAEKFVDVFCRAYARDMDWRISHGMSADEVRRVAAATGGEPPTDEAVEAVGAQWRRAISDFVNDQLREKFLRHVTKMSAGEWEDVRDRLYIVHEHSDRDAIVEALSWRMAAAESAAKNGDGDGNFGDDDDVSGEKSEAIRSRLQPLFADGTVRAAFLSAQEMLPAGHRYRRVAGIKTPYGADVYVEPAKAENSLAIRNGDDGEMEADEDE